MNTATQQVNSLARMFDFIPGDAGTVEHFELINDDIDVVIYPKSMSTNYMVLVWSNATCMFEEIGKGHSTLTSAMLKAAEYAGH